MRRLCAVRSLSIKVTKDHPRYHIHMNNGEIQYCGDSLGETIYKLLLFIGIEGLNNPNVVNRILEIFNRKSKYNGGWILLGPALLSEIKKQSYVPYSRFAEEANVNG